MAVLDQSTQLQRREWIALAILVAVLALVDLPTRLGVTCGSAIAWWASLRFWARMAMIVSFGTALTLIIQRRRKIVDVRVVSMVAGYYAYLLGTQWLISRVCGGS
jgi:hypothetical protein